MTNTFIMYLSSDEICRLTNVQTETLIEFVEYGIIKPENNNVLTTDPSTWCFDPGAVSIANKALRLHRDLEIEWAGIALALDLLNDVQALRQENLNLKQSLKRFIDN